jgi:ribosome-interacting GTPase 1
MPANLTPDYERAEEKYRAATTDDEKLEALRGMYAVMPKHKGTEKLQAELKRKMSHLRRAISRAPRKTADAFHVPKAGAGQIVLVGTPNVGKSSIVLKATGAHVKVAEYPFTTTLPAPGMAHFEDVLIELVDTPPVTADHIPGGLLGTIRQADIIAIIADGSGDPLDDAQAVLDLFQSRGMHVRTMAIQDLDPSNPAEHSALIVVNKMDLAAPDTLSTLHDLYAPGLEVFGVSAQTGEGLSPWLGRLWQLLSAIRVYTKEPGQPPDMGKPFTLPIGSTVQDLAHEIHRDLPEHMKFARVWGEHCFAGMQVHRTEELHDKDVVEIHE